MGNWIEILYLTIVGFQQHVGIRATQQPWILSSGPLLISLINVSSSTAFTQGGHLAISSIVGYRSGNRRQNQAGER